MLSLGIMDDNLTVSETEHTAEQVNISMNEKFAEKYLKFSPTKFKYLKVCINNKNMLMHKLEVDAWDIKYDENTV